MLDILQSMEVVLGIAALVLFMLYYLTKSRANLPPGPPTWPIFGSALSLRKMGLNMIESIRETRAKYGDVFRITRFGRHFIYVNGMENLREFFVKRADAFSDRPMNYHTEYILKGHGIHCLKLWPKTLSFFFSIKKKIKHNILLTNQF